MYQTGVGTTEQQQRVGDLQCRQVSVVQYMGYLLHSTILYIYRKVEKSCMYRQNGVLSSGMEIATYEWRGERLYR